MIFNPMNVDFHGKKRSDKLVAIKRKYININWSKMQVIHNKINSTHVRCMKTKWNPFRDDWEQGFDSDCFAHCSEYDYCTKAFLDKECYLENHMKTIYIPFNEKPRFMGSK